MTAEKGELINQGLALDTIEELIAATNAQL